MNSDRWKQIESLYHTALQLRGAEREAYLEAACAGDADLCRRLLALLDSAESADSFLEVPALSLGLSAVAVSQETLAGQSVDRYELVELLGRGGMGEVYLAHDPRLGRRVALKLLPADITDDPERVRRFRQEARAASSISHPNVAHVYEIGESDGRHYITMEYVDGDTLRCVLRQGTLDAARSLDIAAQVLAALGAAHQAGVVHRDVKPENIMLRADGYVKVLDFGLAKLAESATSGMRTQSLLTLNTEPELLLGTSHYMSPEQVRREPVDGRTDLWSLGVVLYEMLTGRRPFPGQGLGEIIAAIIEREPEPLRQLNPLLHESLQIPVTKALRKQPEERYHSAAAFLQDLRGVRKELEDSRDAPAADPDAPLQAFAPDSRAHPPPASIETVGAREHVATAANLRPAPPLLLTAREGEARVNGAPGARRRLKTFGLIAAAALVATLSAGIYFRMQGGRPIPLQGRDYHPRFERLNLPGGISDIVISPDGKYVASVVTEAGKSSVRIRDLATSSDLQIVPPSAKIYSGLSFSPDGNYVYYLEQQVERGDLYRISKFGGGQRKILSDVNTPASFSPDGSLIAFARDDPAADASHLVVAKADGASERILATRTPEDSDAFIVDMNGAGPSWSPDGKLIACPTVNILGTSGGMNLEVLDAGAGTGGRVNARPWYRISSASWLADGSGLAVAVKDSPGTPLQLKLLSYPGGEVRQLTNDANNYGRVSATSDSSLFLTLNVEESSGAWLISPSAREVSPLDLGRKGVTEVAWSHDNKLVYAVSEGQQTHLWASEAGTSPRQLTFGSHHNYSPRITPDQRHIVFVSTRDGRQNIWRMEADGAHPSKLTSGFYEDNPTLTPDGAWVIYGTADSVREVSVDGESDTKLFDKKVLCLALSPDGRLLAYFTNERPESQRLHLEVFDLRARSVVKRFALPGTANPFAGLSWTPDGGALAYSNGDGGAANLWLQPLAGGSLTRLTDFKEDEIQSFAWSSRGDRLICVRAVKAYVPTLIRPL